MGRPTTLRLALSARTKTITVAGKQVTLKPVTLLHMVEFEEKFGWGPTSLDPAKAKTYRPKVAELAFMLWREIQGEGCPFHDETEMMRTLDVSDLANNMEDIIAFFLSTDSEHLTSSPSADSESVPTSGQG